MKFCANCGQNLSDNSKFCINCGAVQSEQPVNHANYIRPKKKKPGKGFGITSMILGMCGLYLSCFIFVAQILSMGMGATDENMMRSFAELSIPAYSSVVYSIPTLVFGFIARKKGYKNGISMSGIIMGVVSFVLFAVTVIFSV